MENFNNYSSYVMEVRSTASRISGELMADSAESCRMYKDYRNSPRGEYYRLMKKRRDHRFKRQILSPEELKAVEDRLGVLEIQIWGYRTKKGLH